MASPVDSALTTKVVSDPGWRADYPFRGPDQVARVAPFAAIALLAEASLALPPGPTSAAAVVASGALLLAAGALFAAPWSRLATWMPVLVPLVYTGSVLALILAAGSTSGVGIVILIPLVWTALFHRRWESACMVVAIVVVEVIISLTPVAVPGSVIARRVILWAALSTVISVATHGLRDRIRRSREQTARLQEHLREMTVLADRDRIAADLQDKVIQRVFAAGLTLEGAAALTTQPEVRRRVAATVSDLDDVLRILRDTIFALDGRTTDRGLREEVLALCEQFSLVPEVSFSGPVDGALHTGTDILLIDIMRQALGVISQHSGPSRIAVHASDSAYVTVIEAASLPDGSEPTLMFSGLQATATQAGIHMDIEPIPDGTRFTWHIPANGQPPSSRVPRQ